MDTPPYLVPGDKIGLVAPARWVDETDIKLAESIYESWGLKVVRGAHLFTRFHQFAGTDEQRAGDLQQMLDNPEIKAVIAVRGGYGTARLLELIDFSLFQKNPKWVVGYSDISVLHAYINSHLGIESLHAPMPYSVARYVHGVDSVKSLRKALLGEKLCYTWNGCEANRSGIAKARLLGGNLSILYSLSGTFSDIEPQGSMLFIEDVDEYLYHIDRMILNLKLRGKFDDLSALLVGGFSQIKDNEMPFGFEVEQIILEAVKGFDYPVAFRIPSGHDEPNETLILGREATLTVSAQEVKLEF